MKLFNRQNCVKPSCLEYLIFELPADIFLQFWRQRKHIGCPHVLIECNRGYIDHSTSDNNVNGYCIFLIPQQFDGHCHVTPISQNHVDT